MKNLLSLLIFILLGNIVVAQSFNPISGKQNFLDSIKFTKYGNSGALDSVLTVDPVTKKLKFVKNNASVPVVYNGVDSVLYDTATKTMCVYSFGIANCFIITTNAPPNNTGVDSVVVNGTQLCTYTGGVATCYTVNTTINNNQFITNYIDSSITIFNNPTCQPVRLSGSVTIDSLFVGQNTDLVFQINCVTYTANASTFPITPSHPTNDRYTIVYVDTLGNVGTIDGSYSPASIPTVADPASQLLLAVYFIPAASVTPYLVSNVEVYTDASPSDWDTIPGTTTGINFSYTVNPYGGSTKSVRVPAILNVNPDQYFEFQYGANITASDMAFLTFQLRLGATFTTGTTLIFTLYNDNSLVTASPLSVVSGQFGFTRTVVGTYQLVSIPMGSFQFLAGTFGIFNKIRISLGGANASGFQIDRIRFQAGGNNTNSASGVKTFNSRTDDVLPLKLDYSQWFVDGGSLDSDTSNYLFKANNTTTLFSLPTFQRYTTAGYLMRFDSINAKTTEINVDSAALAALIGGGGGGGADTAYNTSEQLSDTSYALNRPDTSKGTVFIFEPGTVTGGSTGGTSDNADSLGGLAASDYQLKHFSINTPTASYTLILSDDGKLINMDVATANNLTIPLNSSVAFPIGTTITVVQYGAGETTIDPAVGVVVRSAGARYKLYEQYSSATIQKIGTNEWLLIGDTEL